METTIQNYLIHNRIYVDLLYDNNSKTPKVIGRVENDVKPETYNIDLYSTFGGKDKTGTKIKVIFKNITSYTNILFDSSANNATIITNFNFEKYNYISQYYEEKKKSINKTILGVIYNINKTVTEFNETLEEIITIEPKNKTIIENYLF